MVEPTPLRNGTLASDAEREATALRLREAAAEGRLTLEDFALRVERALAARTRQELLALTTDLPRSALMPAEGAPARREVAVLGSLRVQGRFRAGHELDVTAVLGSASVDLRGALIDAPLITIRARAYLGTIDVIVPEGVEVEMEGAAVLGSRDVKLHHPDAPPGSPVVRVICSIVCGSVTVRGGKPLLQRAMEQLGVRVDRWR